MRSRGAITFYGLSGDDLSQVVRPRTSPLLREVRPVDGVKHVWCTFSHDQIDLNFRNPEVLKRMVEVIRHYLDQRRAHLPPRRGRFSLEGTGHEQPESAETHEIVRLLRTLVEHSPVLTR
jgi:sucrose phosphorylase